MEERTDQELVAACLGGRQDAFAVLVNRYQDTVFGLAVSMTHNREDAADMAQEAFLRAYSRLEQYNPRYSFRSWALGICANQTKNLFRKRMHRRRVEEDHLLTAPPEKGRALPRVQDLEEALTRIPPRLAVPLRLKHIEGLSYEEVAELLNIGISAVKMRVCRARKQLLEIMNHDH